MNIVGILQARCTSQRLPNKVFKKILGVPMVWHQWQRLKQTKLINLLVLATSLESSDDQLANYFLANDEQVFRGSLNDVLGRYYQCAKQYQADIIVRLTADCPLTDPHVIDNVINFHLTTAYDYSTNGGTNFPYGLDVEVINFQILQRAFQQSFLWSQREHVTLYIRQHPHQFKIGYYKYDQELAFMRWVVDYPEDFELITHIYHALYQKNRYFTTQDIVKFLIQQPELLKLNAHRMRDEGLKKSLDNDETYNSTN